MRGKPFHAAKIFQLKAIPWVRQTSIPLGATGCTLLSTLQMGEALYLCESATVIRECIVGQFQQEWSLGTLLGDPDESPSLERGA